MDSQKTYANIWARRSDTKLGQKIKKQIFLVKIFYQYLRFCRKNIVFSANLPVRINNKLYIWAFISCFIHSEKYKFWSWLFGMCYRLSLKAEKIQNFRFQTKTKIRQGLAAIPKIYSNRHSDSLFLHIEKVESAKKSLQRKITCIIIFWRTGANTVQRHICCLFKRPKTCQHIRCFVNICDAVLYI